MALSAFACCGCKDLPQSQQILKCESDHIYCWECASEIDNICKCKCRLVERPNPLQDLISKKTKENSITCLYKSHECTFTFPTKSKCDDHIKECKFRPYQCVLKKFKILNCQWTDCQHKFEEHYKKYHIEDIGKIYTHAETDSIIFNPNRRVQHSPIFKQIRLINAYNKNFVFYYLMNRIEKFISIIIFLIGTKKDSDKYGYDFTILSPDNAAKKIKIKYSQACFNDNDNIEKIIRNGKCVSLPFYVAENYVENGKIKFYLKITKI